MTPCENGLRRVSLRNSSGEWTVAAKVVVAADGVESRAARWAGLKTVTPVHDMETSVQITCAGLDIDPHVFKMYFTGEFAPGGYVWVFPKKPGSANIGIGISGLVDTYDEDADNTLKIWALDATLQGQAVPLLPDNVELLYEGAWADIQRNQFARDSGVAGDMDGHYVQANVHFAPDFLTENAGDGGLIQDGSHFTYVTRYGTVDLDDYVMRRTTLGLNFRPNESETVIKLDYLMNDDSGTLSGTNDDNIWALSFASYF